MNREQNARGARAARCKRPEVVPSPGKGMVLGWVMLTPFRVPNAIHHLGTGRFCLQPCPSTHRTRGWHQKHRPQPHEVPGCPSTRPWWSSGETPSGKESASPAGQEPPGAVWEKLSV